MGNEYFDDFLRALQASLESAQAALKRRQRDSGGATGGAGNAGSPALTFAVRKPGAAGDEYETLTLPLASFRDRARPSIAALSLEFECELQEKRRSFFSRERRTVLGIRKNSRVHGKKRHKVRIVFHGAEQPFGEVSIDGEPLIVIPPVEGPLPRRREADGKRSLIRAVAGLWRKPRRYRSFVLTEQQAGRIREILDQTEK